jgi:hypothetical protein
VGIDVVADDVVGIDVVGIDVVADDVVGIDVVGIDVVADDVVGIDVVGILGCHSMIDMRGLGRPSTTLFRNKRSLQIRQR